MATVKGQIPVRGVCRNGHTTEATSAKGRVTAEVPCSAPGCDLTVKARRIPAAAKTKPAPAPADDATPTKPATKGRFTPVEVTYAKPADRPADPGPEHEQPGPEQPGDGDGPSVDMGSGEHHSQQQARRGSGRFKRRRPKLSREQREQARAAVHAEWIVPGILPR